MQEPKSAYTALSLMEKVFRNNAIGGDEDIMSPDFDVYASLYLAGLSTGPLTQRISALMIQIADLADAKKWTEIYNLSKKLYHGSSEDRQVYNGLCLMMDITTASLLKDEAARVMENAASIILTSVGLNTRPYFS